MALPSDQAGSGARPVRRFRRGAVPMPHRHRGRRPRLRQTQGQLRRRWAAGRARRSKPASFRQVSKQEMLDIKREAEVARHGQLDDERGRDQGAKFLFLLRLLLPRDAGDQRVQRAGHDCPAAFPAAIRLGPLRLLRQVRGRVRWGRSPWTARARPGGTPKSVASAAGCARWPASRSGRSRMEAVPDYKLPYKSWFALLSRAVPQMLTTSWKVWRQRR